MKQIVYIIFFLSCVMSCSKGYDRLKLIAGDSCQYWYHVNTDPMDNTKYFWYFDREGKFVILEQRYADKKCYLYEIDDVEYIPTWHLVNDSVVNVCGLNHDLTIVNDTFIIITAHNKFHWVDTLYKVTDPHLLKNLQEVIIREQKLLDAWTNPNVDIDTCEIARSSGYAIQTH